MIRLFDLIRVSLIYFKTPLICASKRGNIQIVELLLLQKGININSQDIINLDLEFLNVFLCYMLLLGIY